MRIACLAYATYDEEIQSRPVVPSGSRRLVCVRLFTYERVKAGRPGQRYLGTGRCLATSLCHLTLGRTSFFFGSIVLWRDDGRRMSICSARPYKGPLFLQVRDGGASPLAVVQFVVETGLDLLSP